ncbi:MAG TPA: DUF5590 domain-containing protein [Sporosarcina sp.]|nr:DUF5590 domain-containing protein [Sporosarcina sp.]
MLNWIKFISAFLLALVLVIVTAIFWTAYKPIGGVKDLAEERVLATKQVEKIYDVQPHNGDASIVTITGKNEKGDNVAVFVDLDEEQDKYDEVKLADGISAKEAMDIVAKEQDVKKVMHVLLGLEEGNPVWEVAFKNERGKLNYVYIRFSDGEWSKKILNL